MPISPVTQSINAASPGFEGYLTLGLYVAIATFLIGLLLFISWAIGQRTRSPVKQEPYESGIYPTGQARLKAPAPFYLVAIFFIIFDIEVVFIASWAVAYDLLGWAGFAQITFFILILFLGLVYLWKVGGLDWSPSAQKAARQNGREAL
jgi:NADH-quinone oxidoreductase subunit A